MLLNQVVDQLSSLENEEKIQARKNYELKTLEIVDEFHDGKIINGEIQAIICWYGELQCYKQYIIEELKKKMLRKKLLQQNMHEFVPNYTYIECKCDIFLHWLCI